MSAVQDLTTWWLSQLRDLAPAALRQPGPMADALIVDTAGAGLILRRNRRETPLGAATPDALRQALSRRPPRILLRVPTGAVLERPLVLPLAAEPELDRVVAYEIDRISPFTADEIAWTYAVRHRDVAGARLHLAVAILPRAALDPALQLLAEAGAAPAAVLAPRDDAAPWLIPLAHAPRRRRVLAAAATACALLALLAITVPFVRQQMALDQARERIERLRPDIARIDALRRRIAERTGGLDAVNAEAARVGSPLEILATLTNLIPDDTYLTALSLRQRVLNVSGRSAAATRLIPLLSADPAIHDAGFAAPVTRAVGDDTHPDVFSIRASIGS